MTFDGLWVDHGGLERTADDLMRGVDRIDARLDALARDLEPLRTSWVGLAQEAYLAAQVRWDAAMGRCATCCAARQPTCARRTRPMPPQTPGLLAASTCDGARGAPR
jgi:WXG100 family type VII secretion target